MSRQGKRFKPDVNEYLNPSAAKQNGAQKLLALFKRRQAKEGAEQHG